MKKKVLLTGGLGYVGGRLAKYLHDLDQYDIIIGTRNTKASLPKELKNARLAHTDWDSQSSLEAATKNVHTVIHLAAMNEVDAIKDPARAMQQTAGTTQKLLEFSIKNNVSAFLNISTARVYKNPFSGQIDEQSEVDPDHPYALAHRQAELYIEEANKAGKIRGVNIRLSNCFGAPLIPDVNRWTLIMNDLCLNVVTTKEIVLLSPGLQRRDFITLTEASRAITHIMELKGDYAKDFIFNVGSGWTPSILEIAHLIEKRCFEHLKFHPKIIAPPPAPNDLSNEFTYSNKKLLRTGFILKNNYIKEIDDLLDFCQLNFSKK